MWFTYLAKYWQYVVMTLTALTLLTGYFYVKSLKSDLKQERAARELASANFKQCESNALQSKEISGEYQKSNTALKSQLKRLQSNPKCIPTSNGGGSSGTSSGTKLSNGNGLRSEWLYDFASRAEDTRLKLIGCQSFVSKVCSK